MYATMPRIATPISLDVLTARDKLKLYLSHKGHSEAELSRRSNVPQYTISRFVHGRTKTVTPSILIALNHANIGISDTAEQLFNHPIIKAALSNAWDGTPQGIERIASTLSALAPLLRSAHSSDSLT